MKQTRPRIISYIYVSTRLRVRKASLFPFPVYQRLLRMSISGIALFLMQHGYGTGLAENVRVQAGPEQLEAMLLEHLEKTYHDVLRITTGEMRDLTAAFLRRWDIINVMVILRGKYAGIPVASLREILISAGELGPDDLDALLAEPDTGGVVERLSRWRLVHILEAEYHAKPERHRFARIETALHRAYYAGLLCPCRESVRGDATFTRYLRLEIDTLNFRMLLRLRAGRRTVNLSDHLIPGGTIPLEAFEQMNSAATREEFLARFEVTPLFPLLIDALCLHRTEPALCEEDAVAYITDRWMARLRPAHEVEMAVNHVRLDRMDDLSRRDPFSVLPVIVYLERKRYEVYNLRAIITGLQDGLAPEEIEPYIVL
ncbi:MAG TPA: V-type ATPase subunit [Methanoregulaceae archaeon]|nr:V-type ATPase subunit [Methanoregulaceae archaeon]HQJ88363.1 V-type ATPase subunit [Methanoregulaceae archaeon]